MNFIFVCLFVFVGLLASKSQLQKDVDRSEALDSNAESLGKRSSVRLNVQADASTIPKRDVGKHDSGLPEVQFLVPIFFKIKCMFDMFYRWRCY